MLKSIPSHLVLIALFLAGSISADYAPPVYQDDSSDPACTKTITTLPAFTIGPTKTVYESTVTSTSTLTDCAGCAVQTVRRRQGHGPRVFFTTTKTQGTTTATTFVCKPTSESDDENGDNDIDGYEVVGYAN